MEWTESLKRAVSFMEDNLLEDIDVEDVAAAVHISPFYFQKGFKIMTDYTVGEYIRNRRLYLAALDVIASKEKVIDLAYKYGYDTPESFTRAFSRFHGVSPTGLLNDRTKINPFLPLTITISIKGGSKMDYNYTIEKVDVLKLIGFGKFFRYDSAYGEIPKFWDEYCAKYCQGKNEDPEGQKAVERCGIGEFGVCMDKEGGKDEFLYLIAGRYDGGEVPEGMQVYELPAYTWAKFRCVGPMPGALQSVNTKIFKEWLPGNPDYEMADGINIEWYSMGDGSSAEYESGIWLPVKEK